MILKLDIWKCLIGVYGVVQVWKFEMDDFKGHRPRRLLAFFLFFSPSFYSSKWSFVLSDTFRGKKCRRWFNQWFKCLLLESAAWTLGIFGSLRLKMYKPSEATRTLIILTNRATKIFTCNLVVLQWLQELIKAPFKSDLR